MHHFCRIKVTPPPGERISPPPAGTSFSKFHPRPLIFVSAGTMPIAAVNPEYDDDNRLQALFLRDPVFRRTTSFPSRWSCMKVLALDAQLRPLLLVIPRRCPRGLSFNSSGKPVGPLQVLTNLVPRILRAQSGARPLAVSVLLWMLGDVENRSRYTKMTDQGLNFSRIWVFGPRLPLFNNPSKRLSRHFNVVRLLWMDETDDKRIAPPLLVQVGAFLLSLGLWVPILRG